MAYETPWSWVPPDWEQATAQQGIPLQPGIGIPAGVLEASAPQASEIEMPPMEMRRDPFIGFPTNPDEQPPIELSDPPVDAISSADPQTMPPPPEMQPGLGIPARMLTEAAHGQAIADRDGYVPAMPPEPTGEEGEIEFAPDELTEEDRKQGLQDMDSPEFAAFAAEGEIARQQDAAAKVATAARQRAVDAENDYKIFQESRASARQARQEVEVEAARLANTQVDNDRWMDSRSVGQTIAAFVAAIVGGLVQGRTGGRNDGLAMIERHIERDIEEQKTNIAGQRAAINDKRAAANDQIQNVEADFRAEAAYRAASWERTIQLIDADQANYDPAGTSAIRREAIRREAIGKQQSALMAFEEQQIKRMEAQGKTQLEIAKFIQKSEDDAKARAEAERHNRQAERASLTSAGASYLTAKTNAKKTEAEIKALESENAVITSDELRRLYPNAPVEAFNIGPTSLKKFEKHLTTFGKSADVGKDQSEATIKAAAARLEGSGPGGSAYGISVGKAPLVKKDGTLFEVKDTTERAEVKKLTDSSQNIRRIADLVKIMREDKGGASSTVGSKEYQELKSLASQIDFETFKLFDLGAPSEGDKALAEGVRGGKDITSFIYDVGTGFEAYADGAEAKMNTKLSGAGYDGPYVKLARSEAVQATERDIIQNMDVWSPPELRDSSVDPEIRKRAASRAIESADVLARQSKPHLIRQFVKENEQRLAEGLIDEKQAEKVRDSFRKVYGRRIRDADRARNVDELQELGVTIEMAGGRLDVDALLGIPKGEK